MVSLQPSIGTVDPLLGGISTEAAKIIDPSYAVPATANYFFMIASTFLISGIGWFVVEKIVEPRLGEYKGAKEVTLDEQSKEEKRGLLIAGLSTLAFLGVMLLLILPEMLFLEIKQQVKFLVTHHLSAQLLLLSCCSS